MAGQTPDQPETYPTAPLATRLDVIGLNCPLPALKTESALAHLLPGALLEVETSDPMAAIDIPHAAASGGHTLIDSSQTAGILRFLIRKGGL